MHARLPRHPSSRAVPVALAVFLVAGLLSVRSASAHTFTRSDGNDSPSKIDLRSVSVRHTSNGQNLLHDVRTWNSWTPRALGNDSFFIIQIDKNNDRTYERCAFIFFAGGRLRGSLSNCRRTFIQNLSVSKLNATTARIRIPRAQTGEVYWWVGVSYWDGPAPCANGCVDFSPNLFPDILHDLKPPVASMSQELIQTWDVSSDMTFPLPFTASDAHAGLSQWIVQKRSLEAPTLDWTNVLSGSMSGALSPEILSTGGRFFYRVVVADKQGNETISPMRLVYEAVDVDELVGPGVFAPAATPVQHADAFGGDYVPLDDPSDSYEWTYDYQDGDNSRVVAFIGPGDGDWSVELLVNGTSVGVIGADQIPNGQRQTLHSVGTLAHDMTFRFEVISGTGFGIDAVLI
jgi:hypothetical protein